MQTARNIAIIALVALGVAFIPGGEDAADTALTALTLGFLAAIGFLCYRIYREQQLTLATLGDGRKAILFGALGLIALLIAGADELFDTAGGTLAWIVLMVGSVLAIVAVWREATSYT